MYIKKEKVIRTKKYVLSSEINLGRIDIDNPYWELHYIEHTLLNKDYFNILNKEKEELIKAKASQYNIIENDLYYRYASGIKLDEAIRIGLEEACRYGFRYSVRPTNTNFVGYLNYSVKQEEEDGKWETEKPILRIIPGSI